MNDLSRLRRMYENRDAAAVRDKFSLHRPGELFMLHERERAMLRGLDSIGLASLAGLRILEVGCGRGDRLADFIRWGARGGDLFGIDLMASFVRHAHADHPAFGLSIADAGRLPFPDDVFDVVMQSLVFSSISDVALRRTIAAEMMRVVRPGGVVVSYDLRYPNPSNREVGPIGFGQLCQLFPGIALRVRSATLLPPLARALAPLSFTLCRALQALPPLRSHYLAMGRKPQ